MSIAISVIVPIYNVAPYIERCVRSLMEQTFKDVEYIFVDDCTPDNSIEILQRVIKEYPERIAHIKVLHNKVNKGLAATRFVGLDQASGEYVLHCDSDDWVEKNMLQCMYEKAIKEDADIVCCEYKKESIHNSIAYKYLYDEETIENGLLALSFEEIHSAIWNKLIKRTLFTNHNIRNYSINMCEDSAMTVRLRFFSKKTVIVHKQLYHYNKMNQNSMVANISDKSIDESIKYAQHMEDFFESINESERFNKVINYIKFRAKENYVRFRGDIKKWRETFPESHKYIFQYSQLTIIGRIKWFILAYFPFTDKYMRKGQ